MRAEWLDLSTGINPIAYPIPPITADAWTALPDRAAHHALEDAARVFWKVPKQAAIMAVPGASSAIAQIPRLADVKTVSIPGPTYNEHAASFVALGWRVTQTSGTANASVHVNPNNPDGRIWQTSDPHGDLRIIDESFCDVTPGDTLIAQATTPGTLVLKSFGKFWGLAGLRLGFVIGDPELIERLRAMIGPWAVAGPALTIGTAALRDQAWADATRLRLQQDADRLDHLLTSKGANLVGGTTLFRLYDVPNAVEWQEALAQHHIWSRIFPYSQSWLRLGLPGPDGWARLEQALA
ncbi:MAG: threonine-phosphate decarboxylase [Sulfitobacter sp.]